MMVTRTAVCGCVVGGELCVREFTIHIRKFSN